MAPVSHKCTRVWLGVDSGDLVRKQTRHHVARVAREGILLWILAKLPVHAPCLNWSRFGRSGQKAHTASCVYTAMREGMRYKVYLLLQGLVGAPCYGFGPSSPCMHRVWIGVDSGVPVRKLTRYHMVSCAKTSLTGSRVKFSSRVHLDLEALGFFERHHTEKFGLISCSRTLSGP